MSHVLLIDNYDSFTYNLVQAFLILGSEVTVCCNDQVTVEEAVALGPSHLVISPGSGRPEGSGVSMEMIGHFSGRVPILGVCLGHQATAVVLGGMVGSARSLVHGKASLVHHDGQTIFAGLPDPFPAGRYHSLYAVRETLPPELRVTAVADDGDAKSAHRAVEGQHDAHALAPTRSTGHCWVMKLDLVAIALDHLTGRPLAEETALEEVLLPPQTGRGHPRAAPSAQFMLEQGLQHADRGIERGARRAVLGLAVPAAVRQLLGEQTVDDPLDVLAKVRPDRAHLSIDTGLHLAGEEGISIIGFPTLPGHAVMDEPHRATRLLARGIETHLP